jgi:peroxiredoxin
MAVIQTVPFVTFKTRVRDESVPGPNPYRWQDLTSDEIFTGKKVVLFSLPGAFTPTCSSNHLPRYEELHEEFQALGVDQIICVSVNDAFVMGAWGRELKSTGKVRMMGDGSADFTKATGLTLDLTARGMGLRSNRYSMLVKDGKVATLNIEGPGKFEVSDADTMLSQVKA